MNNAGLSKKWAPSAVSEMQVPEQTAGNPLYCTSSKKVAPVVSGSDQRVFR